MEIVTSALGYIGVIILLGLIGLLVVTILALRRVVPTNEVHIVQSGDQTISYGKGLKDGNVYYKWPTFLPKIGVTTSILPVSNFKLELENYDAYDKGRVPFVIDVVGFFRISDSNEAAQRVSTISELHDQLMFTLKGAVRAILASSEIEEILEGRGKFGEQFTAEVDKNLKEWGVQTVKSLELMDIRDAEGSSVINNIMAKNKSLIEKESRVAVASNRQEAEVAEINAKQAVATQQQIADEQVGRRTAEKDKNVGISKQEASQAILEAQRTTAEKDMAVKQVQQVRAAEIEKSVQIVAAEQAKEVVAIAAEAQKRRTIINAEAEKEQIVIKAEANKQQTLVEADASKQQTVLAAEATKAKTTLEAEGNLTKQLKNAQGIEAEGKAKGAADTAVLLAPVAAQAELSRVIGENAEYQAYLVSIRALEKDEKIGIAQSEALKAAGIKIFANTGTVQEGITSISGLLSGKGGATLAAMAESLGQTPAGAAILEKLVGAVAKPADKK